MFIQCAKNMYLSQQTWLRNVTCHKKNSLYYEH